MKRYILLYICLLISVSLLGSLESHAYRERAHRAINSTVVNQKIASASGSLKGYFTVQLGYSSVRSEVNNKPIDKWFEDAGAQEDEPGPRTKNHFLDPISNSGFSGLFFGVVGTGDPTAVWAQKAAGQQSPGGSYSWQDAREYFFTALTSTTGSLREENLGQSFRALGQVMHLVADMSVPEHTRDNSHITIYTIEKWAEEAFNTNTETQKPFFKNYSSRLTHALNNPVPPEPSLLKQVGKFVSSNNVSAQIPIANLYDFELYAGLNPSITTTGPIGLAEYTNANFFSRNTIFKDYNYPAESSVELYEETDEESGKAMKFIRKIKDGELVEHLAQPNVFHKYLPIATNAYTIVNDKIYADYLEKLIPHAVGYAGALVDYFYRGKLQVDLQPGDLTFGSVKLNITSDTPGEVLGTGDLAVVFRYKAMPKTDMGGNVYLVGNPAETYSYKTATIAETDLTTDPLRTFDFSGSPLPLNFSEMSMQVVYKGKLGNEPDAVAVSPWLPIDGIYTDLDISLPTSGVYAKASDNTSGATFNELRLNVLTNKPGGLSGGTFQLALGYRLATSDQFQSIPVDTEPIDAIGYLYRADVKNGVTSLSQGEPAELVFDLPSLPVSATDVEISLIYTTADGKQIIGYQDISEPTPVDVFNNTDYSCIGTQWYVSGTPEARTAADQAGNKNGFDDDMDTYPHSFTDIYANVSSTASPVKASATAYDLLEAGPVATGSFRRMGYVLTDYSFQHSYLTTWVHTMAPQDVWTIDDTAKLYTGIGFTNQANKGYSVMYTMRGQKMWGGAGVVLENSSPIIPRNCDWQAIPQ